MSGNLCTCGCTELHAIATRETADGVRLRIWSDGAITHAVPGDTYVRGIGRGGSAYTRERNRRAALDVIDNISLFDLAEIRTLVHAAREEQKHSHDSDATRRAQIVRVASRRCKNRAA